MERNRDHPLFNICNLYLLIWAIYSLHWFEAVGFTALDSISDLLLGINLGISVYYFFYCYSHYHLPKLFHITTLLLLFFVAYGLVSVLSGDVIYIQATGQRIRPGSYLIGPLRSFLPFYAFYAFYKRGLISQSTILIWGGLFLLLFIFLFYNSNYQYDGYGVGEFVNNNVYHFTILLPLIFFINKPAFQWAALIFLAVMVFLGMKRGAMLVAFLFFLYYAYLTIKSSSITKRLVFIVVLAITIGLGVKYIFNFYESSSILQKRVETTLAGDSSGRNVLYQQVWQTWTTQSSMIQILFGHGASGSLKISSNYVHNDWLEVLIDLGLVGVTIFFLFWVYLIKEWRRSKKQRVLFAVLGGFIIVLFPRSIYGMMYSNLQTIAVMVMAYCIAVNNEMSY